MKRQKSLLFWPECLPSKYYIELIRILNLMIIQPAKQDCSGNYNNFLDSIHILIYNF